VFGVRGGPVKRWQCGTCGRSWASELDMPRCVGCGRDGDALPSAAHRARLEQAVRAVARGMGREPARCACGALYAPDGVHARCLACRARERVDG
jgi:hypothetical protein